MMASHDTLDRLLAGPCLIIGICMLSALPRCALADQSSSAPAPFQPHSPSDIVPPGAEFQRVFDAGEFTEGPVAAPDGAILFSDIGNRILRFDPTTQKTTVFREPSGRANGLMLDPRGRLVACEGANTGGARRISITEPDGTVRTLADRYQGMRFNSPNDLAIDSAGNVYFTDPRYVGDEPRELDFESVFRITPDGNVTLATDEVTKPNGIVISTDDRTAYVADHDPNGNRHLLSFSIFSSGQLKNKQVLHDFGTARGIDGMTLDVEGNIYATAGEGDTAGIYVFGPLGQHLAFIPTPGTPTNCTFGIADEATTLYVTASVPRSNESAPASFGLYRIRLTKSGYRLYP